ncbi:hypothetical protein KFK09_000449 [Dendrobium nobile]|uniref:Uncharacterized protein n=1 Tax=Dendrobium nobile TaxID=94219 RepID=A0A8T3C8X3_DENNO|nr:hypothetical protein KFK09_000449 [Dendrobium nobile]
MRDPDHQTEVVVVAAESNKRAKNIVPQTRPCPGRTAAVGKLRPDRAVAADELQKCRTGPPTDQISPPTDPAVSAGGEEQVQEREQEPPPPRPPELPHLLSADEYCKGH